MISSNVLEGLPSLSLASASVRERTPKRNSSHNDKDSASESAAGFNAEGGSTSESGVAAKWPSCSLR